jgi:hypothetical protein
MMAVPGHGSDVIDVPLTFLGATEDPVNVAGLSLPLIPRYGISIMKGEH